MSLIDGATMLRGEKLREVEAIGAERSVSESAGLRGSNQSGMRAYNERLVLSLVRYNALSKSDIARITGLSAQTVSVIMRALESDGLLRRGEPIRGKIGQPSVPMSLAANGAYFFGLKIGRRSVDLILVDFLGNAVVTRRETYRYPTPVAIVNFVRDALPALTKVLPKRLRGRIAGLGIAMPFQLWQWAQYVGAPQKDMDAWRTHDIQAEIAAACDIPVFLQNDASAACGAELVFGKGDRPRDFLYFYVGHFIGGGLVLNGQLYTGRTGNAAAIGSMPVPGPDGQMQQLINVASLASLEVCLTKAGINGKQLWEAPTGWEIPPEILDRWLTEASSGLAHAILSACTVIDFEAVLIDGWLSTALRARLKQHTEATLSALNLAGIDRPDIREGTVGPDARTLGAAAIPLSLRYLIDQTAFMKTA